MIHEEPRKLPARDTRNPRQREPEWQNDEAQNDGRGPPAVRPPGLMILCFIILSNSLCRNSARSAKKQTVSSTEVKEVPDKARSQSACCVRCDSFIATSDPASLPCISVFSVVNHPGEPSPWSSFALPSIRAAPLRFISRRRQFRVSDSSKLSSVLATMVHAASSLGLSFASRGNSPTFSRASALSPRVA